MCLESQRMSLSAAQTTVVNTCDIMFTVALFKTVLELVLQFWLRRSHLKSHGALQKRVNCYSEAESRTLADEIWATVYRVAATPFNFPRCGIDEGQNRENLQDGDYNRLLVRNRNPPEPGRNVWPCHFVLS